MIPRPPFLLGLVTNFHAAKGALFPLISPPPKIMPPVLVNLIENSYWHFNDTHVESRKG
jgi:hypothetical protein